MNLRQHILGINMANIALSDSEHSLQSECEGSLSPWLSHPDINPLWLLLQSRLPECRRVLQCSIRLLDIIKTTHKKIPSWETRVHVLRLEDIRIEYLEKGTRMDDTWNLLVTRISELTC